MTDERETKCMSCEDTFDLDVDYMQWANLAEDWMCESCYEAESQYVSTVMVIGPDYPIDREGPAKFYVGSAFSMNQWGDEPDLNFKRTWHSTDAWRGYSVTTIEGWVEVGLEGWTTGGWGDPIADRKQPFNEWVESLFDGEVFPPVNIAVVSDLTSNVFSTAITVYVQEGREAVFQDWLNGDFEALREALG
jgi:hypothetical protein